MLKKSTFRIIAIVFALVLFASFNSFASVGDKKTKNRKPKIHQTSCSKTKDADIVKAIQEQFAADSDIKDQMRHVNVSVKKRTVTLEGWLDGKEQVMKAVALSKKTKCVKSVVSKLKEQGGGSCGPGQKPCGDTCIDRRSVCDISK
ncbi:MAG: BON domain-containing protein [Pyrinomonadaceae bacterium]